MDNLTLVTLIIFGALAVIGLVRFKSKNDKGQTTRFEQNSYKNKEK